MPSQQTAGQSRTPRIGLGDAVPCAARCESDGKVRSSQRLVRRQELPLERLRRGGPSSSRTVVSAVSSCSAQARATLPHARHPGRGRRGPVGHRAARSRQRHRPRSRRRRRHHLGRGPTRPSRRPSLRGAPGDGSLGSGRPGVTGRSRAEFPYRPARTCPGIHRGRPPDSPRNSRRGGTTSAAGEAIMRRRRAP